MNVRYIALAATLILSACATALTEVGSRVQLLSGSEQAARCKPVKMISENQRTGPDKAGNAMRRALNDAAVAGRERVRRDFKLSRLGGGRVGSWQCAVMSVIGRRIPIEFWRKIPSCGTNGEDFAPAT